MNTKSDTAERSTPDPALLKQRIQDFHTRLIAAGETNLAEELIHPDFFNHEADPDRAKGPEGVLGGPPS